MDDQFQCDSPPQPQRTGASRLALVLVLLILTAISLASFRYFYSRGMTNVYHDGIAHVNIARKVVDHPDSSLWQRYIQIGSPWLPVQTVSMLPLVANDKLWRTGMAGSIVSMVSFVITGLAVFLISVSVYSRHESPYKHALPFITLGVFALNPSVLYMQSTPMTELPFMATLSLAVLSLQRWIDRQTLKRLVLAGLSFSLAMLARYEAWPVAVAATLFVALASNNGVGTRLRNSSLFTLVAGCGPVYWLWHNWAIWGDALTFLRGPYSARGLYLQHQAHFGWARMFIGNAGLDLALMLFTVAVCAGPLLLVLALAGLLRIAATLRIWTIAAPVSMFAIPFVFHVVSLYRGEIQMMSISAIGLYNVRYGLPHLLLISILVPTAVLVLRRLGSRAALSAVALAIAAQYALLLYDGPSQLAVFQEAYRNGVNSRVARQLLQATSYVRDHPPRRMILMHTGALGPLVSNGGMRFEDIIHEGSTQWHQVTNSIPNSVRTVILQDGDPLDERLKSNESLSTEFRNQFQEKFSVGRIRVFERQGL
ncbi:MAG TPA: glycosyltransferase family 39 protein [Blastocatellia bacterium]|nr:glycosyltransferase family 39 protein [Blastocatellia bacterium]